MAEQKTTLAWSNSSRIWAGPRTEREVKAAEASLGQGPLELGRSSVLPDSWSEKQRTTSQPSWLRT